MNAPLVSYKRVPGLGSGAFENSRLHVGPDHLLLVGSTAWSESYRRFYFRDIQAVIIRTSVWGKIQNAVWALMLFLAAIIAIQASDVGAVIAWIIASLFALGLVINTLRGPTCVCHIQTAVQTTKLSPLGRLRRAQKFLTQLKPTIAEVQGNVTAPADVAAQPMEAHASLESVPPASSP